MRDLITGKLKEEGGIAMVVVLLAVVIVTVLGSTLVITGVRDLDSATSVSRASSALSVAEAGVQHAIERIRGGQIDGVNGLTAPEPDESGPACAAATGTWMRPDDPATLPNESTQPPADPFVACLGASGRYDVYIIPIDPIDMSLIPPKDEGVYQIVSQGFDNRNLLARPGLRRVEQYVRVKVLDIPFALFSKNDVSDNGTPDILEESLYTTGDVKWRSKLDMQGTDQYYGGPASVHSTKVIYAGGGGNSVQNGPIHPPEANCDFPYDMDSVGGDWGVWPCATPSEPDFPPYSDTGSFFSEDMLRTLFDPKGPDEEVYQFLKSKARAEGTYFQHSDPSSFFIDATVLPNNAVQKFVVIYVDTTGTGDVKIKTGWGPPNIGACEDGDYDGSFGVIVVRGTADVEWENNETWWGAIFVPNGEFSGSGAGGATSGWLIGTIYANSMGDTGNVRFKLNECWKKNLPGPFFDVRRLRWHEEDR